MNVGRASLKLLVMEAQIMCVLEKIFQLKKRKNNFQGKKKEVRLLYVAEWQCEKPNEHMPALHWSPTLRGQQVVTFPNHLLLIIWGAITESCAAFMAYGYSIKVCKSMEDVGFYVGISKCCLSDSWYRAILKFSTQLFYCLFLPKWASVICRHIYLWPTYYSASAKKILLLRVGLAKVHCQSQEELHLECWYQNLPTVNRSQLHFKIFVHIYSHTALVVLKYLLLAFFSGPQ